MRFLLQVITSLIAIQSSSAAIIYAENNQTLCQLALVDIALGTPEKQTIDVIHSSASHEHLRIEGGVVSREVYNWLLKNRVNKIDFNLKDTYPIFVIETQDAQVLSFPLDKIIIELFGSYRYLSLEYVGISDDSLVIKIQMERGGDSLRAWLQEVQSLFKISNNNDAEDKYASAVIELSPPFTEALINITSKTSSHISLQN